MKNKPLNMTVAPATAIIAGRTTVPELDPWTTIGVEVCPVAQLGQEVMTEDMRTIVWTVVPDVMVVNMSPLSAVIWARTQEMCAKMASKARNADWNFILNMIQKNVNKYENVLIVLGCSTGANGIV
jgi:hypothetical protein